MNLNVVYKSNLNAFEKILLILSVFILFLNAFVDKMGGIISYGIYISLLVILVFLLSQGRIIVSFKWLSISVLFGIIGIISSMRGEVVIGGVLKELHRHVFFTISMFIALGIQWKKYLTPKFIEVFLRMILWIGIIATLYALIFQGKYIIRILMTNEYKYYEAYKSFFVQRNVFACFLFFSCVSALYFYILTNKKKYLVYLIVSVVQIYLANSKASLASVLLMICLVCYMKTKNKIFVLSVGGIAIVPIVYYVILPLFMSLTHVTYEGISSTEIRYTNWLIGLVKLIEEKALITGLGMGAEANYLLQFRNYGSFHNVYIDLLFQGGIIKLLLYIYALKVILVNMYRHEKQSLRSVLLAAFVAYFVYSFFESGSMLFSISYFSFLATVLFAILPQCKDVEEIT